MIKKKKSPSLACFGKIKYLNPAKGSVQLIFLLTNGEHKLQVDLEFSRGLFPSHLYVLGSNQNQNFPILATRWSTQRQLFDRDDGSCQLHPAGHVVSGLKLRFCCGFEKVH